MVVMCDADPAGTSASQAGKEETDSRSVFVGNVRRKMSLQMFFRFEKNLFVVSSLKKCCWNEKFLKKLSKKEKERKKNVKDGCKIGLTKKSEKKKGREKNLSYQKSSELLHLACKGGLFLVKLMLLKGIRSGGWDC